MKILSLLLCVVIWSTVKTQSIDPVSLLLAKAIKAVDLKVQRLQNETLVLQRVQQVAEQELAKVKLDEIRTWQKQLSDLYARYFAELKQVKPVVSSGAIVKSIRDLEGQIAIEYKKSANNTAIADSFQHSKEIGQMLTVVLSNQVSMKDAETIGMLYTLRGALSRCLQTMQALNQQQSALVEQREIMKRNLNDVKRLHGIQ